MAKSATLAIKIVSDAKSAGAGFDAAESRLDKFSSGLNKASVAATAVIGGIVAMGAAAYKSASDLQQSAGAVDAVFGKSAATIHGFAKDAAQAVGLAESAYGNLAALLGSQLSNMGYSGDRLATQVNDLIKLGADLAAMYGGTTADAVEALSGVLKGETDPIERYGVSIKQSDINAVLAAKHQDKLTGAAMKAATAQAALGLIQKQTATAVGDFAREADTAAGQTQRASAEFENAKAALGTALLPVVSDAAKALGGLAGWMQQNQGTAQALVLIIGGLALGVLAVNAAFTAFTAVMRVATAVQWLLNIAMDANPIGLIIVGIAALIAIVVVCYAKFQAFRDFLAAFWFVFTAPYQLVKEGLNWLGDKVASLPAPFRIAFAIIKEVILAVTNPLAFIVDKVKWLIDKGGQVASWAGKLFGGPAATVTPGPDGGGGEDPRFRGVGAPPLSGSSAPVRSASLSGGGGSLGGGGGGGGPVGTVVNITVQGAVDTMGTARQIVSLLKQYGVATGSQVSLQLGNR